MQNKQGANRRKIMVVDRAFQYPFIAKFFLMVAAGSLLMSVILYFFCTQTVTTAFKDFHLTIMRTSDFILPGLIIGIAAVIAVVGSTTAFMALYISHRIAGPIYRICHDLKNLRSGDLKQVFHVRNHDQLKSLAAELNETVRGVQQNIAALQSEVAALESFAKDLPPEAYKHFAAAKRILDAYRA
jgi:methyl-accepting chemotaxis protein